MASVATRLERESGPARGDLALTAEAAARVGTYSRVRVGPQPSEVDAVTGALTSKGFGAPYEGQTEVLHLDRRLIQVAGGERAGKSLVSAEFLVTRAPYGTLFWIVADNYDLARPEFNYAVEMLGALGAIANSRDISAPKIGKASVRLKTGQYIETKTADDVRKLAAMAPDGIIMAEAAQQPYEAYLRCVGRLAEKRGWLLMSGTFEGSLSWYADKFDEWSNPHNWEGGVAVSLPSWGNPYVYPGGRDDPEIKRLEALYSRVEGLFEERCGARPTPPIGLVFREFRHVVHVREDATFDPSLPVFLAVDPAAGGNPYSVLVCQFKPSSNPGPDRIDICVVIDEIYEQWQDEDMIAEAKKRPWWRSVYGGAIDVEAPDSRKRWMKLANVTLVSSKVKQLEGIRRLKSFLYYKRNENGMVTDRPHLVINPKVHSLPYEFGRYKRKDPVNEDREPREIPPDDQPNHSIKALWYLLIARYGYVKGAQLPGVSKTWKRPTFLSGPIPSLSRPARLRN